MTGSDATTNGNFEEGLDNQGLGQGGDLGGPIKNQPKLIISNYDLNPSMVEAGDDFYLSFTLYNTNNQHTIYNLKVTIDQTLVSAPQAQGNTNLVSDGSVFTPVDRSNTFYLAALYPWNTSTKEIKMNVLPNANPGPYVINLTMEYEDYLGNQYKTTEAIGIPVVQEAKVNFGKVKMDELIAGQPTNISVNIYNTGKDNLNTFMAKVTGEGFTLDEEERFIGNFNQGTQETYSFTITPDSEGEVKGQVEVTYEDSTGKVHTQTKDFKGESMPGFDMTGEEGMVDPETGELIGEPYPEEGQGSILTSPFLWIGLLVLAILGLVLIRKKRKAKKEEEELTLEDED
ncbi:MAG: LPXTG cell wall anchor domain-containing protein [Anaerococcus sp.]|nr:LPXTG cell wall anchor domain-containing protein [Anaerococcus sp.]